MASMPTQTTVLDNAAFNTPTGQALGWRVHDAVIVAFLLVLIGRAVVPAVQETNFGIAIDSSGNVTIRDLAAHLTFARDFWRGQADYSVAAHIRTTDAWAGQPVGVALPFGYSPTMLYLLAPFCLLPTVGGYVVWTLLSAAAVWWLTRRGRSLPVVTPLVLLSPLAFACFALGQTALLTAFVFVLLFLRHWNAVRDGVASDDYGWRGDVVDAILLWTLTAKPPLAVAAGVALLAGRRWRVIVLGLLLTVATTLALTPQLGWDWPAHYLNLASNYDRQTADAAFAWSLRPDHMTNVRALLWSAGLGDAVAARLAGIGWLAASFGLAVLALWKRLDPRLVWPLAVISFLVFFPHVTSTEDLHLVLLVAVLATAGGLAFSGTQLSLLGLVLLVVFLAPGMVLATGGLRIAVLLAAKLAIAVIWLGWWRSLHDADPRPQFDR